jgi:quinol monooxygenase YgiN
MIVVAGTIELDPSKLAEAKKSAVWMMAETRKEPGNISYVFSSSFEDDGIVHVFEEWESQEALDFHFKTPHMAEFQKQMGGFGIKGMQVQKYQVSSVGPIS